MPDGSSRRKLAAKPSKQNFQWDMSDFFFAKDEFEVKKTKGQNSGLPPLAQSAKPLVGFGAAPGSRSLALHQRWQRSTHAKSSLR
jgi:hypothetical protein